MDNIHAGACFCGAVRYRLTSTPLFVHCCHCRDCQKQTGSAFAINALIETDRLEVLDGTPIVTSLPTDSGRPHEVFRCPTCQSALWSHYGGRRTLSFVRVSTLDEPGRFPPDVHIYTRSKLPWVRLPDGARSFEAYYEAKKEWPAESLARRAAAIAAAS